MSMVRIKNPCVSLKIKIWQYFMLFTAVVFILLWFFQIVFLENFYEGMKISDVKRSAATIVENYGDEDYSDLLTEIAINNDLCIVITDKFNRTVYSKDVMGRNCLIHGPNNMSYDFIQKLRDSEKSSIYFKEFNSTINSDTLIMVSTIGAKDDPDGYLLINTPLVPIGSTASIIKRQLIIITFYLLVLGVIISFFMSKRIADPITRITKSAEGLAEGKYDIKFEGGDYLEIQQLASTLTYAGQEISKVDMMQRDLIANVSHDLRTPLTMLKAYAEMIRDLSGDNPVKRNEHLEIIIEETDRLAQLVNDILDLSKIEAGSVELKYENFDLAVYFNELAASMHRRVVNPQVRVVPVNPYETCTVRLDKNRLAQILTNFVTNAIKYTSKGTIEMGYEKIDENIRLYVRDTGIGIPEDKKDKVFHRFEKLDEFAQGTGLGLSICKAIVEACRGEIGFESEFDKGSLFWAVLPCQFESVNSEPTSSRRNNEKDANKENILDSEETKKVPKRVLVVEDIQSNFFLVSSILKNKCQLLHAPNGLEAVEIVRTQPVDLVLMDMKMPVMDGRTATSEIRKFNAEIPIIALTAHAFDADRVAALKAGCDDYLVKPINGAKLMQTLKEYGC